MFTYLQLIVQRSVLLYVTRQETCEVSFKKTEGGETCQKERSRSTQLRMSYICIKRISQHLQLKTLGSGNDRNGWRHSKLSQLEHEETE